MLVSTAGDNDITSINQQLVRGAISADLFSNIPQFPHLAVVEEEEEVEEEGGNGDSNSVLCGCRLAAGGGGGVVYLYSGLGLISSVQACLPNCLQGTVCHQPITAWPSPAITVRILALCLVVLSSPAGSPFAISILHRQPHRRPVCAATDTPYTLQPDHHRSVTPPRSHLYRHCPRSTNHDLVVSTAQLGASSPLFQRLPTLTTTQHTSHRPP